MNLKKLAVFSLLFVFVFAASVGAVDEYPQEDLEMIIQAGAGGASDMVARVVASEMEESMGVPVVAQNMEGAAGSIAMNYVRQSDPDGYTVGYVPVELSMLNHLGYMDLHPEDFELLGQAMIIPAALTVHEDSPWETLDDFVEYAEENPGEITVGNSGTGSIWHIAAAALEEELGLEFNHIPFDGAAPAVTDLRGGHIDAVTVSPTEVLSGVEADDLRVLGVMAEERSEVIPEVETFKELGYDVNVIAWGGFAAPTGLPDEVRDTLVTEVEKALHSDSFIELTEEQGMDRSYLPPEEFQAFALEQYEYYEELLSEMDLD